MEGSEASLQGDGVVGVLVCRLLQVLLLLFESTEVILDQEGSIELSNGYFVFNYNGERNNSLKLC